MTTSTTFNKTIAPEDIKASDVDSSELLKSYALYSPPMCDDIEYTTRALEVNSIIRENPDLLDKDSMLAVIRLACKTDNNTRLCAKIEEYGEGLVDDNSFANVRGHDLKALVIESCAPHITGKILKRFAQQDYRFDMADFNLKALQVAKIINATPHLLDEDSAPAIVKLACRAEKNAALCKAIKQHGEGLINDRTFDDIAPSSLKPLVIEACASGITSEILKKYAEATIDNPHLPMEMHNLRALYAAEIINSNPALLDEVSINAVRALQQKSNNYALNKIIRKHQNKHGEPGHEPS